MIKEKYETREEWLNAAIDQFRPIFEAKGKPIPEKLRVSTGWPHKSAVSAKSRRLGECWSANASADSTVEIFISPCMGEVDTEMGVLPVLVHEAIHAAVGNECGHKGPFKKLAVALGLEGKMTSTHAGGELLERLKGVAEDLGPYPHATLDLLKSPRKKQGTRMIKCECGQCGFTVRMTRKWIDDVGPAHCPKHGEMTVELPDEPEDESGEE